MFRTFNFSCLIFMFRIVNIVYVFNIILDLSRVYFAFRVLFRISLIFINLYCTLIMTRILSIVVFFFFIIVLLFIMLLSFIVFIILCSFYFLLIFLLGLKPKSLAQSSKPLDP